MPKEDIKLTMYRSVSLTKMGKKKLSLGIVPMAPFVIIYIGQIVDDYFEDSDPGERAIARERIEQVSKQCHDFIIYLSNLFVSYLHFCQAAWREIQ